MNNFENSSPLDYAAIYQEIIKKSINRDSEIITLTLLLKNLGYSKKKIKSEIKKYKKQKKKINKLF